MPWAVPSQRSRSCRHHPIQKPHSPSAPLLVTYARLPAALKATVGPAFRPAQPAAGIAVSVLNFALTPFSVVISALFRRDMEFGKLAICNLVANAVSIAISIALAVLHYSYMAPIWGAVAGNVVLTVLLIGFCKNRRVFRPSLSEYPDVISFGLYSGGVSIINVFYNLAPQIFLARILDFAAVGLYSRAIGITQVFDRLVGQVLSPVIMPAIFAQTKAGGNLKNIYLDAIALLTAVHWPFLIFMAIMAQPIILIWLGPTWLEIVPLVRMMCIGYLSLFVACLTYPVLVAVGSVRDALVSSLISLPPSLLVIFIASFFGVQAVAASAIVTLPFQAAVAIYFVSRHLDIGWSDLFRATFKSAIVTLISSNRRATSAHSTTINSSKAIPNKGADRDSRAPSVTEAWRIGLDASLEQAPAWGCVRTCVTGHGVRPHRNG